MKKLAIFGDTSQDLTYEIGEQFGIEVLPYYIQMGNENYKDLEEMTSKKFYETMGNYDNLSTGTPPPQDITNKLDEVKERGYEQVLVITSSEKLTGMYALFGTMRSYYEDLDIHLFDTNQIGGGAGIFTVYAGQLNQEGKSLEDILEELNRVRNQVRLYALFRTLKYLVKGGRFNKYKGMIGTLLNINPLLTTEDGEIIVKSKVRGKKSSLSAMIRTVKEEIGDSKRYRLIIFSGQNPEEVKILKDSLKEEIENAEHVLETEFTPVLGCHAGPNSIGVGTMRLD